MTTEPSERDFALQSEIVSTVRTVKNGDEPAYYLIALKPASTPDMVAYALAEAREEGRQAGIGDAYVAVSEALGDPPWGRDYAEMYEAGLCEAQNAIRKLLAQPSDQSQQKPSQPDAHA